MGLLESVFGWTAVGIAVPLIVAFGWVEVSIPNPQFNVAQWAFTAAAGILILRLGLWISVEHALSSVSRWPAAIISFVVFGFIGGIWIAGLQWVDGLRSPSKSEANGTVTTTRQAFSKIEKLRALPPGMEGNEKINLDNVAILRLLAPSNDNVVTLILDPVVSSPPVGGPVTGAQVYTGYSQTLTFDRFENKRHEIPVEGRTFIVTLLEINHIAEPANLAWSKEYVFGVSEK